MVVYIAGFICALVLAAIVMAWIAYCMFIKERHKSEYYQYNISDIQHKNYLSSLRQDDFIENDVEAATLKKVEAGILIIPSKKNEVEYEKRPDYPESPVPTVPSPGRLLEILKDGENETFYSDGIYEVDKSALMFHTDV